MAARTPGYGELLGRLEDLEDDLKTLRNAVMLTIVLGLVFWLDLRQEREAKHVD
jgi:hypothetical protein